VVCWDKKHLTVLSYLKNLSDQWKDPSYDRGHCFSSHPAGIVFQLDGAPPHFSRHVCAFLDREFPDCWLETEWQVPPHSHILLI
jgi:hypothetical protein